MNGSHWSDLPASPASSGCPSAFAGPRADGTRDPAVVQVTSFGHAERELPGVDESARITLRHAGRLHHLLVGAVHRGKRVLALVDTTQVTVIHLDTGEILDANTTNYWRNTQKEPDRWPGSS